MPYPDTPEESFDYSAFEQSQGDGSFPGQEMDTDLADIRQFCANILAFLQVIQRSDGALNNGIVQRVNLASDISLGFNAPSTWATATDYVVADTVFQGSKFYICTVAHTSGVFATDLASGRWDELVDLTDSGALQIVNDLSDLSDAATARTNLGLGPLATDTTVPVSRGGTGVTTAAAARTALGLAIGTDVQAYSAKLAAVAGLSAASGQFVVGDGSTFTAKTPAEVLALVGGAAVASSEVSDWDNATAFGSYWSDNLASNLPSGVTAAAWVGMVAYESTTDLVQFLVPQDANRLFLRRRDGGTWGSFFEMALTGYVDGLALGVGQTWQNMSASRAAGTSYQNTTGRPIEVSIQNDGTSAAALEVSTDGSTWVRVHEFSNDRAIPRGASVVVPDDHYYRLLGASGFSIWAELR